MISSFVAMVQRDRLQGECCMPFGSLPLVSEGMAFKCTVLFKSNLYVKGSRVNCSGCRLL